MPRKLGSIPKTKPENAVRLKVGETADIAGTEAPESFAAHICLTDMRAMKLEVSAHFRCNSKQEFEARGCA